MAYKNILGDKLYYNLKSEGKILSQVAPEKPVYVG